MKLILAANTHLEGRPACIPDPGKIIPYEAEKYRKLKKQHSVLKWKSWYMAGILLDIWEEPFFDRKSSTLYLSVVRPVGVPYLSDGLEPGKKRELICDAEPRWVSVSLAVE